MCIPEESSDGISHPHFGWSLTPLADLQEIDFSCDGRDFVWPQTLEVPIDSGIALSIRIDNLRVFINKTLSTESLINQLLIKRACLSISIDSR